MNDLHIGPPAVGEWEAIRSLLDTLGLPEAGLSGHLESTRVARRGRRVVGCVAVELYPPVGLLRSLAVRSRDQGVGIGDQLVGEALALAEAAGVHDVYLLTETAEAFFAARRFRPIPRDGVPEAIRQTVEFSVACPDSAAVMVRRLG